VFRTYSEPPEEGVGEHIIGEAGLTRFCEDLGVDLFTGGRAALTHPRIRQGLRASSRGLAPTHLWKQRVPACGDGCPCIAPRVPVRPARAHRNADVVVLVIAYKMGAKELGVFTKAQWLAGLTDIGCVGAGVSLAQPRCPCRLEV
jgi:hypothetical protein